MIATHEDRLLAYALHRVLGEEECPDLAPRVVAAWERGERRALPPAAERAPLPPRALRRRSRIPVGRIAAGVLALAGLSLGWWSLRERAQPAPLAVASRPLQVVGGPQATTALAAGTRLVVDDAGPVRVEVAGGVLELAPGSTFALRENGAGMELERGGVRAIGPTRAFAVGFGFGEARLRPGAVLAARRIVEQGDAAGDSQRAPVELRVRAGAAEVELAGASRTLHEPDALVALADPESSDPAALDRRWILEHLVRVAGGEAGLYGPMGLGGLGGLAGLAGRGGAGAARPPRANLGAADARRAAEELEAFLESRPLGWSLLQGLVLDVEAEPRALRAALAEFLARTPSPRALEAARSLWLRVPESFSEDDVVAFAERGVDAFERETRARVEAARSAADAKDLPVRCAAHLAFAGDPAGRALLAAVRARPLAGEDGLIDAFLAARGLEVLGDAAAWPDFVRDAARRALKELDRGREEQARWTLGVLALHDEPPRNLPAWGAADLWGTARVESERSPEELRAELVARAGG